jgi:uncharacterized protein (DUF302 family)
MTFAWIAVGIALGMTLMGLLVWNLMPRLMLVKHRSRLGFDATVTAIEEAAKQSGWNVSKIYEIDKSLREAGHDDVGRIRIISMCQPHHAHRILRDETNLPITAMMPCRIGICETPEGVFISQMNIGLMSRMFGGVITEVMGGVAREERKMLEGVTAH